MSDRTWELAKHCVEAREVDAIRVVGKTEPVTIYELLALKGELPAGIAQLCEEFEAGLAAYRRCDWDAAQARFQACLALKPDDGPSRVFATRVKHLAEHPPGLDWDRVWSLADK
jgi:adenylate cyclase